MPQLSIKSRPQRMHTRTLLGSLGSLTCHRKQRLVQGGRTQALGLQSLWPAPLPATALRRDQELPRACPAIGPCTLPLAVSAGQPRSLRLRRLRYSAICRLCPPAGLLRGSRGPGPRLQRWNKARQHQLPRERDLARGPEFQPVDGRGTSALHLMQSPPLQALHAIFGSVVLPTRPGFRHGWLMI